MNRKVIKTKEREREREKKKKKKKEKKKEYNILQLFIGDCGGVAASTSAIPPRKMNQSSQFSGEKKQTTSAEHLDGLFSVLCLLTLYQLIVKLKVT